MSTEMKNLESHLVQYALYHRDNRNIRTHLFGVPLIVLSVILMTYVPLFDLNTVSITVSSVLIGLVSVYYLYLSFKLGVLMLILLSLGYVLAMFIYTQFLNFDIAAGVFYLCGASVFVLGWVIQFIGHYYEGKKPAFVDDLVGLLIGPLFVLVEVLFMFGLMKKLEEHIVAQAGPYRN
ncbi:hypothetical protein N476_25345 [Pseudoalteromonas luteoviolacea H33]|uniref:DUF962 domain-containing protein n=2 Tax=Pseudoalteromonas luteoviolacea TaxID=43657 RepID=A0A167AP38_9GAMM|nr:hypothetical protein N476_25345 [Pseudoalteromonas luteoviolacea H33]KZN69734.1 hypothetical protein N477_26115 [Pseudoalteromonas luteoviolacea H33-S]